MMWATVLLFADVQKEILLPPDSVTLTGTTLTWVTGLAATAASALGGGIWKAATVITEYLHKRDEAEGKRELDREARTRELALSFRTEVAQWRKEGREDRSMLLSLFDKSGELHAKTVVAINEFRGDLRELQQGYSELRQLIKEARKEDA